MLEAAIIQILRQTDEVVIGAGLVCAPKGRVLTCAHVIADAAGAPRESSVPPSEQVSYAHPATGSRGYGRVVQWSPFGALDVAVLELDQPIPNGISAVNLWDVILPPDAHVRVLGFPEGYASGLWVYASTSGRLPNGLVQLHTDAILPGFSGSPVQDLALGRVTGIMTTSDPAREAAFVIPCALIHLVAPEVLVLREAGLYAPLTDGLANLPGDPLTGLEYFLREYLGTTDVPAPFGGRQKEMALLTAWLRDPEHSFALLTAPAGRGKSALIAQWAMQTAALGIADVVLVPVSNRFNLALKSSAMLICGARLRRLQGVPPSSSPLTTMEWVAEIASRLREPRPSGARPLLIVMDGLDEAADWEPGRDFAFPIEPGMQVKILLSARLIADAPDKNAWAARLNLDQRSTLAVDLNPLDSIGLQDVLSAMGNPLSVLATKINVTRELLRLSEGDPLLVRLYIEALRGRGQTAAFIAPEDLSALPPGLDSLLLRWWIDQRVQWKAGGADPDAIERGVRSLLYLFACAHGPLLDADIAEVAPRDSQFDDGQERTRALHHARRFVTGSGPTQGYAFSHPRLRDHFKRQMSTRRDVAEWSARFVEYGQRTIQALRTGALQPQDSPGYVLRYYTSHLTETAAPASMFYALVSREWLQAWERLDGTYDGFLNDVELAWQRAESEQRVSEAVRCALCATSVKSTNSRIPAVILSRSFAEGLLTGPQLLVLIRRLASEANRAEALKLAMPGLDDPLRRNALEIVDDIREPGIVQRLVISIIPLLEIPFAIPWLRRLLQMSPIVELAPALTKLSLSERPYVLSSVVSDFASYMLHLADTLGPTRPNNRDGFREWRIQHSNITEQLVLESFNAVLWSGTKEVVRQLWPSILSLGLRLSYSDGAVKTILRARTLATGNLRRRFTARLLLLARKAPVRKRPDAFNKLANIVTGRTRQLAINAARVSTSKQVTEDSSGLAPERSKRNIVGTENSRLLPADPDVMGALSKSEALALRRSLVLAAQESGTTGETVIPFLSALVAELTTLPSVDSTTLPRGQRPKSNKKPLALTAIDQGTSMSLLVSSIEKATVSISVFSAMLDRIPFSSEVAAAALTAIESLQNPLTRAEVMLVLSHWQGTPISTVFAHTLGSKETAELIERISTAPHLSWARRGTIVPDLSSQLFRELACVRDSKLRRDVLVKIAPWISGERLRTALTLSRTILDTDDQAAPIVSLASSASHPEIQATALQYIRNMESDQRKAEELRRLIENPALVDLEAVATIADSIRDEHYRGEVLVKFAQTTGHSKIRLCVERLFQLRDRGLRVRYVAAVVALLEENAYRRQCVGRILSDVAESTTEYYEGPVLEPIARCLTKSETLSLLDQLKKTQKEFTLRKLSVPLIARLINLGADEAAARYLVDDDEYSISEAVMLAFQQGHVRTPGVWLNWAKRLRNRHFGPRTLTRILPYLDLDTRAREVVELKERLLRAESGPFYMDHLLSSGVLDDAVVAGDMLARWESACAAVWFARRGEYRHVSTLLRKKLDVLRREGNGVDEIVCMVPVLEGSIFKGDIAEVIDAAINCPNAAARKTVLTSVVRLSAAQVHDRARVVNRVLGWLRISSDRQRSEFLIDLAVLLPIIERVTSVDECLMIVKSATEITEWWP
jgi:Trypsin-like peptidase domain